VWRNVAREEEQFAGSMCFLDALGQNLFLAEFIVAAYSSACQLETVIRVSSSWDQARQSRNYIDVGGALLGRQYVLPRTYERETIRSIIKY
jgi:hypothetical protein